MPPNDLPKAVRDRIDHYMEPDNWSALEGEKLASALHEAQLLYGCTCEASLIEPLSRLYRLAMTALPRESRMAVKERLSEAIRGRMSTANALFPFALVETERAIVASTAIDLSYYMTHPDEPLAGARKILKWIEGGYGSAPGALFGGLIDLGDDRVTTMLRPYRDLLQDEDVYEASLVATMFPSTAAFEFWLDWLDRIDDSNGRRWGACVTALSVMIDRAAEPTVYDTRRNFCCYISDGSEDAVEILERLTFEEVGRRYADRLYALEAREVPPKLVSHMMKSVGLTPRAPRHLQFRFANESDLLQ